MIAFALTKGQRSKRQLSKSFTVVILPLSTRLIKPNFCLHDSIVIKVMQELWQLASSVLCDTENNFTCLLGVLMHG